MMASIRTLPLGGRELSGFLAALCLAACIPADPPVPGAQGTGGGPASTGGQPGSGGAAPGSGGRPGSGGAGGSGSGGLVGTGGSAGRGGTGGRVGTGGSSSNADAGASDGGGMGGGSGTLPAGYAVCAPCHGNEGAGVSGHGPDIQHPVVDFSTWVIRNGRTHPNFPEPMAKFTTDMLPDAQLQGILSYLAARPKPTTGAGLFIDFCANCHGADAKGGVTMRPIDTEPMSAFLMNVRNGHHAGEFSARRDFMPKWTAAQLSDADVRLIATHVGGL
jgi:mono/diheme cytochrome c family protein